MGLLLDPKEPVEREIEGTKFLIRVFTSREYARFVKHLLPLQRGFENATEEGGEVSVDLTPEMIDHLEQIVTLGVAGVGPEKFNGPMPGATLDAIPFRVWSELYAMILEVNSVSEGDAKN